MAQGGGVMGYYSVTGYSVRYAAAIGTLRYGLDLRPGEGWAVRDGWGLIATYATYAEMEQALRGWGIVASSPL